MGKEVHCTCKEEKDGEVPRVLHLYTAERLSSFGELALMNNKPLQASVRAVTSGTLWALKREDFRGILTSKFSNLSSLKLLRSVDLLSRLTILQLSHIAESLSEVSFSDGQIITDRQIKAFLESVGTSFCPDYLDWFGNGATDSHSRNADQSVLSKFLQAHLADFSTTKLQGTTEINGKSTSETKMKRLDYKSTKLRFPM